MLAVGRRKEPLLETADLASGEVRVVSADIGHENGRAKIIGTIGEKSRVKYLVHSAGICPIESVTDITPDSWHNVMATNVDGRLFMTLRLLPWLQRDSRVLFVGSNSATKPRKGSTAYCVSEEVLSIFEITGIAAKHLSHDDHPKAIVCLTISRPLP